MNLNELIAKFFIEDNYHQLAERIVVMRRDGIPLYSNNQNNFENSSIGALVSGLWQAAESLSSYITRQDEHFFDFRLSFDTSSDGLFVLPFQVKEQTYYLCSIYQDVDNPAKLKNQLKSIKSGLEVYLSEFSFSSEENRKGYLFDEISDDEMDNLFAFGGL